MKRLVVLVCTLALGSACIRKSEDKEAPSASADPVPTAGARDLLRPESVPAPADVAAPPDDAAKTASGLATKVIAAGTGTTHPAASDTVKVNYTGWTTDGKMFDSSVVHGKPATFGVGQVIPGWTEGLELMVVGEKRRMWIPASLAYGSRGMPGIPPNSALTFDVELLDVIAAPKPPPDVAAAPADAKKTASGLAYKLLSPGAGNGAKPGPTDTVTVSYSGWTTDGKMFDSTVTRGQPATFPLNHVIKGWTEGLQLMKVGDKMRFWIPGNLAYDDPDRPKRAGAPQGTLVFDVELVNVGAPMPMRGRPPH